jgi:hypothetical protein
LPGAASTKPLTFVKPAAAPRLQHREIANEPKNAD